MYKFTVIALLLSTISSAPCQNIDSPKLLSLKITRGLTDPRKKLDAIFDWVTSNIEYDTSLYQKWLAGRNMYEDFDLDYGDSIAYNEAVAEIVLKRKMAVCDGYARLFKSLCNHSRIRCEVVSGQAKSVLDEELQPHAWNAVRLEGKWYLVDPTWASGYVIKSFVRKLNMFYYLTPPEKMFINHLPDDLKWIEYSLVDVLILIGRTKNEKELSM